MALHFLYDLYRSDLIESSWVICDEDKAKKYFWRMDRISEGSAVIPASDASLPHILRVLGI